MLFSSSVVQWCRGVGVRPEVPQSPVRAVVIGLRYLSLLADHCSTKVQQKAKLAVKSRLYLLCQNAVFDCSWFMALA